MDIDVEVEADAWLAALPDCERICREAAEAALSPSSSPAHPRESGDPGFLATNVGPIDGAVEAWVPAFAGMSGEMESLSVAILLTDDAEVRQLNRDHRRQDKPTNVLSFPAAETAIGHLGDLALAYETCAREANEQGKPLGHHLAHLVVHGVLHLTGWDHEADAEAEAMERLERTVLARLGVPDPYAS
jgi:probable rRNA maturation factor